MADKRISQLIERVDIANDDVLPIVASGATTTNKVTVSTLQDWMQENVDVGVTSVGITIGSTGTDVNVTGSPVTSSGNITINLPTASATNRGLLSAADWTTFNNKANAGDYVTLATTQTITAQKTFTTSGSSDTMIISHGSGSGFALDVLKAGNGEAIRVTKTSGSGNAMTISGGNFEAGTIVKTGGTSVQYLMADGSVSTLTNPVTGTGTAGQVSFWNGTNTQTGDNGLFWDNTNKRLGVGTNVPSAKLHVTNGANSNGALRVSATGATVGLFASMDFVTGTGTYSVGQEGNGKFFIYDGAADRLVFSAGGANSSTTLISRGTGNILLNPSGTGNVGISTATPNAPLHVASSGVTGPTVRLMNSGNSVSINDTLGTLDFYSNDASAFATGTWGRIGTYAGATYGGLQANVQTYMTFSTSSNGTLSERWRITSTGILQSNGAQTIQTSTGNLTLATAAGNGNIVLSAHGDGNVTTNDSIYIGSTSGIDHSGISNKLSVASTGYNLLDVTKFSNDNFGGYFYIGKSRGSTVGDYTIVQNGDQLGSIIWQGSIGTSFQPAAVISAEVDGVPGSSSDMPGRLIFATCSDNSTFAVERLRIDSTGVSTFSGALNGTSAVFSEQVRINHPGQSLLIFPTTTNSARIQIQSTGGGNLIVGTDSSTGGDLASGTSAYASVFSSGSTRDLFLGTNSVQRLKIDGTTGAATFSSSVTLTSGFLSVDGFGNKDANYITLRAGFTPTTSGGIGLKARDHSGDGNDDGLACYGHDGISFLTAQTERMKITSDGSIAMLTTPTTAFAANVHMTVGGTIFRSTSSLKYKNSVLDYDKGLEIVNQLRPVYYKGNNDGERIFAGLIAEEVHDLGLTEFVQYAEDGSPDSLAYQNMIALAFKAIQELKTEIDSLKNQMQ